MSVTDGIAISYCIQLIASIRVFTYIRLCSLFTISCNLLCEGRIWILGNLFQFQIVAIGIIIM